MRLISMIEENVKALFAFSLCLLMGGAAIFVALTSGGTAATAALPNDTKHLGVATCSGSTCHGRSQPDGKVVRQDEIMRWQEASSPGGAHSRSLAVLNQPRAQAIAKRLGIASAATSQECLGCHTDNAASRGPIFQISDGVGCEACHGGSQGWIEVHKTGNRAASLRAGLVNLNNSATKAAVCLDCHYGSADGGQFVSHRIMAAGHPRLSFELDLFTTLQQHHNEDADYAARKGRTNNVRVWAIGQAMAIERSLSLHANPTLGTEGAFPEFYFLDCHSCHRRIYDDQDFNPSVAANPGRPVPLGTPPYNDENIIMLSAAAKIAAPALAQRFDADSRAFHAAMGKDRASAVAAGVKLRATAGALASAFQTARFDRPATFAVIDLIASEAINPRFTDYSGSVQAVMAVDTLLNALVNAGQISGGSVGSIRSDINRAYGAVREPNDYRPAEFRRALGGAVRTIRTLR